MSNNTPTPKLNSHRKSVPIPFGRLAIVNNPPAREQPGGVTHFVS